MNHVLTDLNGFETSHNNYLVNQDNGRENKMFSVLRDATKGDLMRIVLVHNRLHPLVWKIKRKYKKFRLHLHKDRRHWMFTWKPKLGKNHGSPQTLNYPLC